MSCAKKNLCCHYCDEQKKCTSRCKDNLKSCVYFADEPIVNDDPMLCNRFRKRLRNFKKDVNNLPKSCYGFFALDGRAVPIHSAPSASFYRQRGRTAAPNTGVKNRS